MLLLAVVVVVVVGVLVLVAMIAVAIAGYSLHIARPTAARTDRQTGGCGEQSNMLGGDTRLIICASSIHTQLVAYALCLWQESQRGSCGTLCGTHRLRRWQAAQVYH